MRVAILFFAFILCSIFFCSSEGTPVFKGEFRNKDATKGRIPYSIQEEKFIIEQLKLLGKPYDRSTWIKMAEAHKRQLNSYGFEQERTPDALNCRFLKMMKREEGCDLVTVPDSIKKMVLNPKRVFSPEEKDLIKKELMSCDPTQLKNSKLWENIANKINLKRQSGAKGFLVERTGESVRKHIRHIIKGKHDIPEAVIQKISQLLGKKPRGSSKGSTTSKKQPGQSQKAVGKSATPQEIEAEEESLNAFITELENDPELAAEEEGSLNSFIEQLENDPDLVEHYGDVLVEDYDGDVTTMVDELLKTPVIADVEDGGHCD